MQLEKELEELIDENITSDFKKIVNANYLNKLEKILSLCSEAEALYVLNVTLKVLHKRFDNE